MFLFCAQDLQSKNETMKAELKKLKEKRRTPAEKTLADLRAQNQKLQETLTKTNQEHSDLTEALKIAKKQIRAHDQQNKVGKKDFII